MTDSPKRIQRKRTKGWRMPEGAVYVGRPTRWGNPFTVAPGFTREWATANYRAHLVHGEFVFAVADVRRELAGRELACWCPLDQPCHADVLLEVANR